MIGVLEKALRSAHAAVLSRVLHGTTHSEAEFAPPTSPGMDANATGIAPSSPGSFNNV